MALAVDPRAGRGVEVNHGGDLDCSKGGVGAGVGRGGGAGQGGEEEEGGREGGREVVSHGDYLNQNAGEGRKAAQGATREEVGREGGDKGRGWGTRNRAPRGSLFSSGILGCCLASGCLRRDGVGYVTMVP